MTAMIDASADGSAKPKKPLKTKVVIIIVPVVLLLLVAVGWFCGIVPDPFARPKPALAQSPDKSVKLAAHPLPVFIDLPEMVTNLNVPGRRPVYVKFKAQVELAKTEDRAAFAAAQPHVVDLFQTYLREMHPEELRGSAGTYRLRGEFMARANLAIAPERIVDILFSELLVQ